MKTKYIVPIVLAIIFGAIAFYSMGESKIEYDTIKHTRETGKKTQIVGKCINKEAALFVQEKNAFIFNFKDKDSSEIVVKYSGVKPQNFDVAEQIVVKGKIVGDTLVSSEILTKCASKYSEEKKS